MKKFEIKEEIDIIRKDSGAESNAEEDDDYYGEKYYGRKIPAYAYLGPKYCPMSFYSENTF